MLWRRRRTLGGELERDGGLPPATWELTLRQTHYGSLIVVTAEASPASPAPAWWQWYINGQPQSLTAVNRCAVSGDDDDAVEIGALALATADIDPWRYVPHVGDGRVTVEWLDRDDDDIATYRVDWALDAAVDWSEGATIRRDGRWRHEWLSPRFEGGHDVYLQVVSVTAAGDEGLVLQVGPLPIRRRPEAIEITVTYSAGTQRVTVT